MVYKGISDITLKCRGPGNCTLHQHNVRKSYRWQGIGKTSKVIGFDY